MQVNFQNQMNFPQNESDEEYEIIEIYERDRYDDNELFPFNINFVLPGKSTSYFSSQNQNHSLFNKQNEFSYNGYKQQNNNQNNIRFYSPPSNPPNISIKSSNLSKYPERIINNEENVPLYGQGNEVINNVNFSHDQIQAQNQNNKMGQVPPIPPKSNKLNQYFSENEQKNINQNNVPTYAPQNLKQNYNNQIDNQNNVNMNPIYNLKSVPVINNQNISYGYQHPQDNKSISSQALFTNNQNINKDGTKVSESAKFETKTNIVLSNEPKVSREEKENLKDAVIKTIVNPDGTTSTVLQKTYVKYITENEPINLSNLSSNMIQNNVGQNSENSKNNISYMKEKKSIYTTVTNEVIPVENAYNQNINLNNINKSQYEVVNQNKDLGFKQINSNEIYNDMKKENNIIPNNQNIIPNIQNNMINPENNIPNKNIIDNNQYINPSVQNNNINDKNIIPNQNMIQNTQNNYNNENPTLNNIINPEHNNNITYNNPEPQNMNYTNKISKEFNDNNFQQNSYNENQFNIQKDNVNYEQNNNQIIDSHSNENEFTNYYNQGQKDDAGKNEDFKEQNNEKLNYNKENENVDNNNKLLEEKKIENSNEGYMNSNEVQNERKIVTNEDKEKKENSNKSYSEENIHENLNEKEKENDKEYINENEDEINDYENLDQNQINEETNKKEEKMKKDKNSKPPSQKGSKKPKKEKENKIKNENEQERNYRNNNIFQKENEKYSTSSFKLLTQEKKPYKNKTNTKTQQKDKKNSDILLSNKSNEPKKENNEDLTLNKNAIKNNINQSGDLKFNPKISKSKPFEPLFSKYEQLEGQSQYNNADINVFKEPVFKKSQEIFPSHLGIEMPYKSKLRESLYNKSSTYKNFRRSRKKDTKSNKKSENEFDSIKKDEKTEKKTYYTYKSSTKSNNPFKGPSEMQKSSKERKNNIARTVEKEENEFYDIALIEEKIANKSEVNEEELNQLISRFNEIMYKDYSEKEELKGYEYKINKIGNIVKNMGNKEQNKILEDLKKNADNEYKKEMFQKLKSSIEDYNKNRKYKMNKNETYNEEKEKEGYSVQVKSTKKKNIKKSI